MIRSVSMTLLLTFEVMGYAVFLQVVHDKRKIIETLQVHVIVECIIC